MKLSRFYHLSFNETRLWELIATQRDPMTAKALSPIFDATNDGFCQREWISHKLSYWHRRGFIARPGKGRYCAPHIHARAIWILSPA